MLLYTRSGPEVVQKMYSFKGTESMYQMQQYSDSQFTKIFITPVHTMIILIPSQRAFSRCLYVLNFSNYIHMLDKTDIIT